MIGIIGGTGFIGLNLSLYLQEAEVPCRTFSRHGILLNQDSIFYPKVSRIEHIKGDFHDKPTLDKFVKSCSRVVLLVSHLLPSSAASEIENMVSQFGASFVHLLEVCVAAQVEQLVFISSGGTIYGENSGGCPVDENYPLNSQCAYGSFCAFLERLIRNANHRTGLPFTILRLGNPYGLLKRPKKDQGLIDHYIRSARARKSFTIFGDGSEIRDYIYIDDISQSIARVLLSPAKNDTFNVGTGHGTTSDEVIKLIRENFDLPEVPIVFGERRPTDVRCSLLNMDKFEKSYGARCEILLAEGLAKYAAVETQARP
jgi:UDP-glucose 4-epimerase